MHGTSVSAHYPINYQIMICYATLSIQINFSVSLVKGGIGIKLRSLEAFGVSQCAYMACLYISNIFKKSVKDGI